MVIDWHDSVLEAELQPGQHHVCVLQDRAVAIFNLDGNLYAIEDCCTHQGLPLSEGPVEGDEIECPFHGARFCIKTGKVTAPPACVNLTTFEVRIHEGRIQVKI